MVDVTDRYFRFIARQLTVNAWLYTEMINENQFHIIFKKKFHDLILAPGMGSVVFQLGGSDPNKMASAAKLIEELGYNEVNVNCGCPSTAT